jgi:hypothetical protein
MAWKSWAAKSIVFIRKRDRRASYRHREEMPPASAIRSYRKSLSNAAIVAHPAVKMQYRLGISREIGCG